MNWQAEIWTQSAIIGRDPEMADMVNPKGYIYGDVHAVVLTADDGTRLVGPSTFGRESGLAKAIQRSLDKGYDPTTSEAFREMEPAYASEAYIRGGWEYENALIERNEAAIYG